MWHKPCRTFHPWCPCIKTRCLSFSLGAIVGTHLDTNGLIFCQLHQNNSGENYTKIWEYGNGPGHRGTAVSLPISETHFRHYDDVIMSAITSRFTSLTTVYLIVYSRTDQRKHQSSAWLAFVRGIHRWLVNSSHKRPVTWTMFSIDDVIIGVFCCGSALIDHTIAQCLWSNSERCGKYITWSIQFKKKWWNFTQNIA